MLDEQLAHGVGPLHLDIAYERRGDPAHPPVLLIMGIAAQLIHWPEGFLDALVAHGLQVIRFDNRDSGLSTHLRDAGPANLAAALRGDLSTASYTLSDMAADAVGLLDHLGIGRAHLVGASLGGAIAQTAALEHVGRVQSLTTMMSTTGDPAIGQAHPATLKALFGAGPPGSREEAVVRAVARMSVTGSPAFPTDPADVERIAGWAYERDHDSDAVTRQAVASIASGDRTARLRRLQVPTLVVHGLADTLCDPSGGRATAAAIPGAELLLIEGMGHNLPPALWQSLADHLGRLVRRGEAS